MKLAFFIPDLRGGGAQRMIVNMANEFVTRGHTVDLVLVQNQGEYQALISPDVNIIDLNQTRSLRALPALTKYIKAQEPDILLSAMFYVNIIAVLAKWLAPKAPTKIVVSERNHLSTKTQNSESLRDRVSPWIVRLVYPFADAIVGISQGVISDLKNHINVPAGKLSWIHNPVITSDMPKNLEAKPHDEWLSQQNAPIIIMSGRFAHQKDYPTALNAFAQVLQKTDARLLILGEGELREELEQLVQQLGIENEVHFAGFVENSLSYMNHADLFLISSVHEGFGNVIVEALMCGLPVVATDCPSGPAEILKDGKYGTLVPVANSEKLSDAIVEMLKADKTPEKQKARAMDFTVEKICDQYQTLFTSIAAEKQ